MFSIFPRKWSCLGKNLASRIRITQGWNCSRLCQAQWKWRYYYSRTWEWIAGRKCGNILRAHNILTNIQQERILRYPLSFIIISIPAVNPFAQKASRMKLSYDKWRNLRARYNWDNDRAFIFLGVLMMRNITGAIFVKLIYYFHVIKIIAKWWKWLNIEILKIGC